MKKALIIFGLLIFAISLLTSCEKDEICIDETTPLLIIRFYDYEFPDDFKKVLALKIQIDGISGDYTNETITAFTDSIAIPIRVTQDSTRFKLIINGIDNDPDNDNEDIFDLNYIREDVFVSRSCGYKTIFYETEITLLNDDENWIKSIEFVNRDSLIVNQKNAHVKIFH